MNPSAAALWRAFLDTLADPTLTEARWYESFQIGNTVEGGNLGARLILQGVKKATSSLLWEYVAQDKLLPQNGSLSIVQNGHGDSVCVVESTWVAIRPFNEVDAEFARDYGEGDGTLTGWRTLCWDFYEAQCRDSGWLATETMPLVCERFKVVYPITGL